MEIKEIDEYKKEQKELVDTKYMLLVQVMENILIESNLTTKEQLKKLYDEKVDVLIPNKEKALKLKELY